IVLRPVLSEAVTRCQERGGDTLTDPGPIRDLHRQFSSLGEFADHSIDTAGQDRAETLSAVHAALASGRYRLRSGIAADR
ncbi:MAG: ATP-binding protein, partial [Alphaproteobacteria bacterium]